MGEVYLGEQLRLGDRPVAVKVVRPEEVAASLPQPRDLASARDAAQRFMREGAVLGQLAHPNILPVHDSGLDSGYLYLVMQYAPDGSLADAIAGRGPQHLRLPVGVPFAADVVSQLAAALQYTHDRGVVHRDVKPSNVLVQIQPGGHWHVLLADFGIARGVESTAQAGQITGTIAYMAPEQFSGRFSPASDQFALGALAYLLLTDRTPFTGGVAEQMQAHLYDTPPPVRAFNPLVALDLAAVICRALNKRPADRWPSVAAFAAAFREAAAEAGMTRAAAPMSAPLLPAPSAAYSGLTEVATARTYHTDDTLPNSRAFAVAPPPYPHPRDPRRRALVFVVSVALFALAIVAAVKLKPLSTAQGYLGPGSAATSTATSTATSGGTALPTVAPAGGGGQNPTVPPTQPSSTPTAVQPASSPDAASLPQSTVPVNAAPGQRITLRLTFVNVGSSTWSSAAGYAFVCDTVRHPDARCRGFPVVGMGTYVVAPGGSITFTLPLRAPTTPGAYLLWWNLARSGQLFRTADVSTPLSVRAPTSAPSPAASPSTTRTPKPTATVTATPTTPPTYTPTTPSATAPTLPRHLP